MDKNNSENKLSMNLNPCWNTPNIILKNGDVFAYKLESEYAKEKGLHNQYLIMQKAGELEWPPGHIIPMVRVKITKDNNIPKTEEEVNKLEYIETSYCEYETKLGLFEGE